jgi:hypothetical protein
MLLSSLCHLISRPQYRLQFNQLVLNQRVANSTSRFLQKYCRQLWLKCKQRQPRVPLLITLFLVLLASSCLVQCLQLLYKEDLLLSRGWKRGNLVLRQLEIRGRKAGEEYFLEGKKLTNEILRAVRMRFWQESSHHIYNFGGRRGRYWQLA